MIRIERTKDRHVDDLPRRRGDTCDAGTAVRAGWFVIAFLVFASGVGHAQDQADPTPIPLGIVLPPGEAGGVAWDEGVAVNVAARRGLEMAIDELGFNASVIGFDLDVSIMEADGPDAAAAVAEGLISNGVLAVAGGYGEEVASAIGATADEAGVAFLNIGTSEPTLRNERCSPTAFHIEPSGGMYLDALAGWFVSAGFRDWHVVHDDGAATRALLDRFERTLRERHFGARIVGREAIGDEASTIDAALEGAVGADVTLLLVRGGDQLRVLERAESLGLEGEITAFPWPETQTRAYYEEVLQVAPNAGAGHRASAWEPTLDAYGARELNARFEDRFGEPMDAPAWAAYQAIKLPYEAVTFGGVRDREGLIEHLASDEAVFDVWKGIGVTFRPWNHQLRQTLFLVELQAEAASALDRALLVGELPAIYMPRTDPVERLDQLGDLEGPSTCSF